MNVRISWWQNFRALIIVTSCIRVICVICGSIRFGFWVKSKRLSIKNGILSGSIMTGSLKRKESSHGGHGGHGGGESQPPFSAQSPDEDEYPGKTRPASR